MSDDKFHILAIHYFKGTEDKFHCLMDFVPRQGDLLRHNWRFVRVKESLYCCDEVYSTYHPYTHVLFFEDVDKSFSLPQ